jgi:hypothetical protein
MSWLSFKKKYGVGDIYGDDTHCEDPSKLPLDPVAVAGSVRMGALRRRAVFRFVVAAVLTITNLTFFTGLLKSGHELKVLYGNRVHRKYKDHEAQLASFGLVVPCPVGQVRFVSTYFAVAKSGEPPTGRSIFNGRKLSANFIPPEPINLPEIPDALRRLHEIHNQNQFGKKTRVPRVLTADLRHWFHQLTMRPSISRFFCLSFQIGRFMRWATLPMGWSHSPRIAQSISWWLVMYEEPVMERPVFVLGPAAIPTWI